MIGVVVVLGLVAVGAYFLYKPSQMSTSTQTTVQPEVTESKTATGSTTVMDTVVELVVTSEGLKFTPNELKVKEGDRVKITYKNTKGSHDFVLDEFGVKTSLVGAGKEETVEFVANKKGSFEFYCSVPGHRAAGMKGMLIVE